MEEFISKFTSEFHNLQGDTIAEKKRNLFHLFNQIPTLQEHDTLVNALSTHLQPQTHLEQIFYIEFLIRFQKYNELVHELLVNENYSLVKRLKNQKWFFERIIAEAEFFNKIVTTTSYNLMLRILKNVVSVLKEHQADNIFTLLVEVYGISTATLVITSCSSDKIEEALKNHYIKLRLIQLKALFDKNANLVNIYLEEREKHEGNRKFMDSHPIFKYIAQKNQDMYQDLCLKYDPKINLGKRTTNKFISTKRHDVITNPEMYVKNLHPRCLIKKLGPDFPQVYLKLFPKRIEDSPSSESSRLLKYYPKNGQYNLMLSAYNKIFSKKIEECPHLIDEFILEMITDPLEREKLVKIKFKEDPDLYVKYCTPESCFKIVKDKMKFARAPYERSIHVATMTQCCIINNDYKALLELVKFVNERFKNDVAETQERFVSTLIFNKGAFNQLTDEHWIEIKKIMARPELFRNYAHSMYPIFYKYLEHLIKLNRPINEEIINFFKQKSFDGYYWINLNISAQRIFLSSFIHLAPEMISETNSIENMDCNLLEACHKYNLKNAKHTINVHECSRLLESVKTVLKKTIKIDERIVSSALEALLCAQQINDELEELRELFWDNIQFATPLIIKWMVKYRPRLVEKNLNIFLDFTLKKPLLQNDKAMWNLTKCYSHLNIDKQIIEYCISELTPSKCYILSFLMQKHDFLALVESYKPTSERDIPQDTFNIQIALLNGLRNTYAAKESLPLILQFCTGDYMLRYLNLLYTAVMKIPKNELLNQIEEMKNSDLQKYCHHLISTIFDKTTVLHHLTECNNDSSVKICFKYFLINPSEESWGLFAHKLNTAEKIDASTSILIARKCVPLKYKSQHFETVWTYLDEKNPKYKNLLLKHQSHKETVSTLDQNFMQKLIDTDLFNETHVNELASIFLITSPSSEKFRIFRTSLENFKKSQDFSLQPINNFVNILFTTYLDWNMNDETLADGLLATFQRIFPVNEIFTEYVILFCMKYKGQHVNQVSTLIIQLHNEFVARFGETITGIFADILKQKMSQIYKTDAQIYELYSLLLTQKQSVADVLLVIKLLPTDSEPEDQESCRFYELIVSQLQELNLSSVQLHLNLYFKCRKILHNVSYYERVTANCFNNASWLFPGARKKIGYCYY